MSFYLVDMQIDPEGIDQPMGLGEAFSVVAWPYRVGVHCPFSLYELSEPHGEPVSASLRRLLWSAAQYPPARAQAFDDISLYCGSIPRQEMTRALFLTAYEHILRFHLQNQPHDGFLLARSLVTQAGDLFESEYYWIVGYCPVHPRYSGPRVAYVTHDLCLYTTRLEDFDLNPAILVERLPPDRADRASPEPRADAHPALVGLPFLSRS